MVLKGAVKMNLGFYMKSSNAEGINGKIFMTLNEAIADKKLRDASVFFDNIDYNSMKTNFGMFNSTDVWHFTGYLVSTCLETTVKALKAVNRFTLRYLYNPKDSVDVMRLIDVSRRVEIIAANKQDQDYVYRITGKKAKLLKDFSAESFAEVF